MQFDMFGELGNEHVIQTVILVGMTIWHLLVHEAYVIMWRHDDEVN